MKQMIFTSDQRGAAGVELVVVAAFFLVSVFTLTPLVGKMIDTKHKVEQAGRYAAWERTVWFQGVPKYHPNKKLKKTNVQLQNEIHQRVFSEPDSVVQSEQHKNLKDIKYDPMQNFFNREVRGKKRYQTMMKSDATVAGDPSYVRLNQVDSGTPGKLSSVTEAITKGLDVFGEFKVNRKGYYTGDVAVEIKEFKWLKEFSGIKPVFSTKTAILTDGWNAGGPNDANGRVKGLFPLALVDGKVGDTIQDVAGFFFKPLRSSSLELGKVTSEPVPGSRLKRYPN